MPQKIIVTTCPWKDYKTGKWMLSAMMNIQLETPAETTLGAFPDILKWMEKIQQAVFYVQWGNAAPVGLKPINDKWNPALYEKLFHSGIKVKGYAPTSWVSMQIKSFPVAHINSFILDTFKEVGNLKINELPKASFFTKDYTKLNPVSKVALTQTAPIRNQNKKFTRADFLKKEHAGQAQVKQQLAGKKVIGFNKQANVQQDFGQVHNYFAKKPAAAKQLKPVKPKDFEYHDVFSVITSYPVILRKLGLIVDFVLPAPPSSAKGTVRIVPTNLNFAEDVTVIAPNTSYESTASGFYAAPKAGSPIEKGVLKLNTDEFDIVTYDTDAAAVKLISHAESVIEKTGQLLLDYSNYSIFQMVDSDVFKNLVMPIENEECGPAVLDDKEDTDEGLPSLRSAGIGLVKNGLAENIYTKLKTSEIIFTGFAKPENQLKNVELLNINKTQPAIKSKDAGTFRKLRDDGIVKLNTVITNPVVLPPATQTLFADDLVQGYRMDIAYEERPAQWYSLHKRKNTYGFLPVGASAAENIALTEDETIDEGCINIALVEDANDEDENTDKVNEVIARWQGWSLAVPKPGKGINEDNANIVSSDAAEKEKYKLKDNVPFRMQVNTGLAPKTLPMLRFGKSYRLKVRTVDIAGNSLPHDVAPENANVAVKTGIKYLRYEPLPVPVLVGTDEIATKANDRVRERDGESLEHMVIRSNVSVSPADYEKQNPTNIYQEGTRNVVNTLTWTHEAVRHLKAPRNSQHMAETHGMFDESFRDPAKAAEAYNFIKQRDIETDVNSKETKAPLARMTDTNLPIEYLADPMAAGVVFVMKSNTTFESNWKKDQARKFSFYFDDEVSDATANTGFSVIQWKNPKSFRIKLIEGNGAVDWNKTDRILLIALPKSAEIEIKYASFWRPDDVDRYSAMQPIIGSGTNRQRSLDYARKGLHWMFSPWRNIRLVHAVQQPLEKPTFEPNTLKSDRNYNDTFAKLSGTMKVHGSSTDKVDIEASWTEQIDDLKNPNIITGSFNTHVATLQTAYCNKKLTSSAATTAGTAEERRFPLIHHPFNDTKHRIVNYRGTATSRYREYFTGIIETGLKTNKPVNLTQTGDAVQLNILSTARPATAVVDYIVPSFNWLTNDKGTELTRMRTGNIRVYLQRPWFSSGDDEMLGVLLPIKNVMLSTVGKLHCTVWGKDPVFNSPELNGTNYPQVENFPFAAAYDTVSLAEDESTKMTVAAYKVLFDEEKQLHYADIPININQAYFPFVRLCVARYQPHSLKISGKDCCLGASTTVDWLQVVPVRYTALYFKGSKAAFDVALRGTSAYSFTGQQVEVAGGKKVPSRVMINVTVTDTAVPKTEDTFIRFADRSTKNLFVQDFYLDRQQFKGSQIEFVQRIDLPGEFSGKPYRVEIREYELHEADPIRTTEEAKKNFGGNNIKETVHRYEERLVFMDVIEVNG